MMVGRSYSRLVRLNSRVLSVRVKLFCYCRCDVYRSVAKPARVMYTGALLSLLM